MALDPRQVARKWSQRLASAVEDVRVGVQRVNVAPTRLAAQKADKWFSQIQRAYQEGKWQDALNAVDLEEWRQRMINVGLARIPSGAQAAENRMAEFFGQLLPYVEQVRSAIAQMPDTTIEQRIQRAVEFMRRMAQFRYRRGRA